MEEAAEPDGGLARCATVAETKEERKAFELTKGLIEAMEKRIQAKIAELWGED